MSRKLEIDVLADAPAWQHHFSMADSVCRRAAAAAFDTACRGPARAEVGLVLSDDARVRRLNRDHRGLDRATNVLSFPGESAAEIAAAGPADRPLLLGDIVVAYETVAAEAEAERKDFADHLSHLIVHGMLHLLGYDHRTDPEADEMERLEARILATLGVADPHAPEEYRLR